jgi:protein-S-isoprenylcysteine O-methyltransferase Ste14
MSPRAELALRLFLPCYFVAYILIGGVLAVVSVRRKYGVDPLLVRRPDPLMALGETYRNLLFAATLAMVVAYALRPSLLGGLAPIPWLQAPAAQGAGATLLVASLVLLRAAQVQLKGSWRPGFDRDSPPAPLVTTGLFAWSRNPIYVAMSLTGLGLFLALPNAVSFAIANLTVLLLQVRIRVEEDYLAAAHGEAFAAYRRRTPRWLFGRDRKR